MKKWWVIPFVFAGGGLAFLAHAFCPVCAAAAVVGLSVSRYLGVDDSVTGVWIGGLLVMLAIWTIVWLKRRFVNFKDWWQGVVILAYYLAALAPLWWLGKLNHPLNRLWGVDKLVLGVTFGTLMIILALKLHDWLKTKNTGKSYFQFQRMIMVLGGLIIMSAIFYFLSK